MYAVTPYYLNLPESVGYASETAVRPALWSDDTTPRTTDPIRFGKLSCGATLTYRRSELRPFTVSR